MSHRTKRTESFRLKSKRLGTAWEQHDEPEEDGHMYTMLSKIGWPRDPGRPEGSHWTAMTGPTQGSMFLMRHLVRSQMSHGDERARCFLVTFPARFTLMGNFDRKDPNVGGLPRPCFTMNSHCLHFDPRAFLLRDVRFCLCLCGFCP